MHGCHIKGLIASSYLRTVSMRSLDSTGLFAPFGESTGRSRAFLDVAKAMTFRMNDPMGSP